MAPSRKRGSARAAAAAAARQQWKVGDLVLAKMKGFPAWPAVVYSSCFGIFFFCYAFSFGCILD